MPCTKSQNASSISRKWRTAANVMPALLTSTSIVPKRSMQTSNACSTSACDDTSQRTASAALPSSAAVATAPGSSMSAITTDAPSAT